jgi:hypothetical protein
MSSILDDQYSALVYESKWGEREGVADQWTGQKKVVYISLTCTAKL